jgi:hypothetical protein
MDTDAGRQRSTPRRIARRAMIEHGSPPGFSHAVLAGLDLLHTPVKGRLIHDFEGADAGTGSACNRSTRTWSGTHRLEKGRLR